MTGRALPAGERALTLVGFDSAWADNPRNPGAICALRLAPGEPSRFDPPRPVGFEAALAFIRARHGDGGLTILAIDQPTIVPNETGMRRAERAVASVMSFSGGAIQPANRGRIGMFDEAAPVWRFLDALGFTDDPETAAEAAAGGFVMEVFPALALLSLDPAFMAAGRCGPRYNPSRRKTFRLDGWAAACRAAFAEARRLDLAEAAVWCDALPLDAPPRKSMQDALDAVICLLAAARWRRERSCCLMVGDLASGYIVAPASAAVRTRLGDAAARLAVPLR